MIGAEFRLTLFDLMKKWDLDCCGKELKISEEYFSKLRIIVKTDPNESYYSKIENGKKNYLNYKKN